VVAATDPRVAFPFLDGLARAAAEAKSSLRNLAWFEAEVLKRLVGRSDRVAVTAEPGVDAAHAAEVAGDQADWLLRHVTAR
jgi:hypothetical protein